MSTGAGSRRASERVIAGRYRLAQRLGSGGMGAVWAGWDLVEGQDVAVKEVFIPESLPSDSPARQVLVARMLREVSAASRVDHPAVVTVYDVVEDDGRPWMVMERIHGESLEELLRRQQALTEPDAARIALKVVEALQAAHACGVLHRDVKPANVLLGEDGRVVLADFGIAYVAGETTLTRSGEFVGSFEYVAPERMGGRRPQPASDLWSLGVLLYRMVEGWSPFRRVSVEGTLSAVISGAVEPPLRAVQLRGLILGLLTWNPEDRPTPEEIIEVLTEVIHGRPVAQTQPTTPEVRPSAPAVSTTPSPVPHTVPGKRGRRLVVTTLTLLALGAAAATAHALLHQDPQTVRYGPPTEYSSAVPGTHPYCVARVTSQRLTGLSAPTEPERFWTKYQISGAAIRLPSSFEQLPSDSPNILKFGTGNGIGQVTVTVSRAPGLHGTGTPRVHLANVPHAWDSSAGNGSTTHQGFRATNQTVEFNRRADDGRCISSQVDKLFVATGENGRYSLSVEGLDNNAPDSADGSPLFERLRKAFELTG
ncbi:serine/threonine-protein kinase [Streptomyces sp. NPDC059916]|uniref:serine/threonine-protein kinase n=1 Tax=Streptomyces sp. NPDC059916 TaxID=3347001 RepID=UPI0036B042C6